MSTCLSSSTGARSFSSLSTKAGWLKCDSRQKICYCRTGGKDDEHFRQLTNVAAAGLLWRRRLFHRSEPRILPFQAPPVLRKRQKHRLRFGRTGTLFSIVALSFSAFFSPPDRSAAQFGIISPGTTRFWSIPVAPARSRRPLVPLGSYYQSTAGLPGAQQLAI